MGLNFSKNLFPPRGEILTNFDFIDIASGVGIQLFYGIDDFKDSGTTFFLSDSKIARSYQVSGGVGLGARRLDGVPAEFTFDTNVFNLPRTLNGTPTVNISLELVANGGSVETKTLTIKLVQVHVGGGTTDLTTTIAISMINTSTNSGMSFFSRLPEITNVIIKKGEKIRLSITPSETGSNDDWTIFFDPSNSKTSATIKSTELIVGLPFKIDVT